MVPVLPAKSVTHNKSFLDRLQRVEKHLRKNKLKLTLTQRLGNAQDEDDVRQRAPINLNLTSTLIRTDVACPIVMSIIQVCAVHTQAIRSRVLDLSNGKMLARKPSAMCLAGLKPDRGQEACVLPLLELQGQL